MRQVKDKERRQPRPLRSLCEWARTVCAIMREDPYDEETGARVTITRQAVGMFLGGWKGEWVTQAMKCGEFLQNAENRNFVRAVEAAYQHRPLGMGSLLDKLHKERNGEKSASDDES